MKLNWEQIQSIAKAHHLEEATSSMEAFARFLRWWWCRTYNRPLKDPLLEQYTLNELCYEFLRHYYLNPENDPKKEMESKAVQQEDDEWIKSMLAKIPTQAPASETKSEPEKEQKTEELPPLPDLPDISTKFDPES